jgi:hypothetical protein
VKDSSGQKLAAVYYEEAAVAAKMLTRDEARRIATNIAKLPGVVTEGIEPGDTNDTRSSARDIPTIPVRFNAGRAD